MCVECVLAKCVVHVCEFVCLPGCLSVCLSKIVWCVKCMRVCGGSGQTPLLRREGVAQKCISYFKVFKIIFKLVVISASIVRSYLSSPSEWNQLFKI